MSLNTDQAVNCPRCDKKFECKPDDISTCECSKIELSKEEYRFISSKFNVCVCNACLKELKEEYTMSFHYQNPENAINKLLGVFLIFVMCCISKPSFSQPYAPPVGQTGTGAMHMDSSAFINWATACTIIRGYQDISDPSGGLASVGDASMATGKAQSNAVVSLGDRGVAVCTFDKPIVNGPGYDFAVFENGFDDLFLELAFVEVSSDGTNFFRFHSHSLTDTTTQTSGFGPTDAIKINNLAGKYRGGYGTPFDLQEFAHLSALNVNAITHVRIVDVVGSINSNYASRDFYSNKVNDPWPTAFPSGGFDLDAVGVIHELTPTGLKETEGVSISRAYPNPVNCGEALKITGFFPSDSFFELVDASGKHILKTREPLIQTSGLSPGIYCLIITGNGSVKTQKIVVR